MLLTTGQFTTPPGYPTKYADEPGAPCVPDTNSNPKLDGLEQYDEFLVKNAEGTIVAKGQLSEGKLVEDRGVGACQIVISAYAVPADSAFYTIEIPNATSITLSADQALNGASFTLTIDD